MLMVRLYNLDSTDHNIMELSDLGANLSTFSMAFNSLTNQGLCTLLIRAPHVVSLDLMENNVIFAPDKVVPMWQNIWDSPSVLCHLNVSGNAPDLLGYAHLF